METKCADSQLEYRDNAISECSNSVGPIPKLIEMQSEPTVIGNLISPGTVHEQSQYDLLVKSESN